MAQIDIDKFVISLMRYFGNNKGIVTTLDRCLFSLGLKYVDTPTGGRLERVDQPTMLEKIMWGSGEQKTVDKVKPKFKVGDWIVYNDNIYQICNISLQIYYECLRVDGTVHTFGLDIDSKSHLWTIEDAKDGGVVVDKSDWTIGIFQSIGHHPDGGSYNDPSYCFLHCRYDDGFFYADFEDGNTIDSDYLVPATKKQRDLLFQKMKEAGYEWDAEKKELKKIEQKPWSEEVDLNKEIELVKGDYEQVDVAWNNDFDYIAKHFFELGLNTSNPLTWEDVKEICVQSVLVEIDLGGKISDERHYTEVLKRFKAQKGEKV